MLEAALKNLFDFQRFERNSSLQDVIDEVLDKYAKIQPLVLSDDVIAQAAGGTRQIPEQPSQETDYDGRGTV